MDQEKFGKFIRDIRKKNNLTQKELANKYNVTYQAVSKWENGKNMPDMLLIKQISEDFNISLDEMFESEIKKNKNLKSRIKYGLLFFFILLTIVLIMYYILNDSDFEFKTLSSTCDNFTISGNIAYNNNKSSIYITNIKYCGEVDNTKYKKIECILFESYGEVEKKISSSIYEEEKSITLEKFLQTVTIAVDDYKKTCKEYSENSLYLSVNATDQNDKVTTYKIPLSLEKTCLE